MHYILLSKLRAVDILPYQFHSVVRNLLGLLGRAHRWDLYTLVTIISERIAVLIIVTSVFKMHKCTILQQIMEELLIVISKLSLEDVAYRK
jgi:hypothetical protein